MKLPFPLFPTWFRWLGVFTIAGFIFYASIITVPPETIVDDAQPWFIDLSYWRHIVAYATLSLSLAYATDHWRIPSKHLAIGIICLVATYGAVIEVGQYFVPYRHFDLLDIVVNTIGASLVIVYYLIRPYIVLQPLPALYDAIRT